MTASHVYLYLAGLRQACVYITPAIPCMRLPNNFNRAVKFRLRFSSLICDRAEKNEDRSQRKAARFPSPRIQEMDSGPANRAATYVGKGTTVTAPRAVSHSAVGRYFLPPEVFLHLLIVIFLSVWLIHTVVRLVVHVWIPATFRATQPVSVSQRIRSLVHGDNSAT